MTIVKTLRIIDDCIFGKQTEKTKVYDLNLSENYAPDWGAWEVAREVICNAIDADPENYRYHSEYDQNGCQGGKFDVLIVETDTVPTIAQLKVLGHGTKSKDSSDIGQFGEGLKLAALTAARAGGMIQVQSADYDVVFALLKCEDLDERVLHMIVDPPSENGRTGCQVRILMLGINDAIKGKFAIRDFPHLDFNDTLTFGGQLINCRWEKTHIYVKGVWICDIDKPSLFKWSFGKAKLNRDRGIIDPGIMDREISCYLNMHMNKVIANQLISHPLDEKPLFELDCLSCYEYNLGDHSRRTIRDIFIANHGEKAIISSDDPVANSAAQKRGYKPVAVHHVVGKLLQTKQSPILNSKNIETTTKKELNRVALPGNRITEIQTLINSFKQLTGIEHNMHSYIVHGFKPELLQPIVQINHRGFSNYDVHVAYDESIGLFVNGWMKALLTSIPINAGTKLTSSMLITNMVAMMQKRIAERDAIKNSCDATPKIVKELRDRANSFNSEYYDESVIKRYNDAANMLEAQTRLINMQHETIIDIDR